MIIFTKRKIKKYLKDRIRDKISQHVSNGNVSTESFYKLVLKYLTKYDKSQYIAVSHLKQLSSISGFNKASNIIDDLLPNQRLALPGFFRNEMSAFNAYKCLGIGESEKKFLYDTSLDKLRERTNALDCNHFLNLLLEEKPFHYLKYTHGFWDAILESKINEYAIKNGKDLVISHAAAIKYNAYNVNNFEGKILELVNSDKFVKMVKNNHIYFSPALGSGAVSNQIELGILRELSEMNILYDYSKIALLREFSKKKSITPANIFKKIICTDTLRERFVNIFDQYNLVLICNHRVAANIMKIYPKFKHIYCLPDRLQGMKHFAFPMDFADNICKTIINKEDCRPTLILSQAAVLSTFISYVLLTKYKDRGVSLIDIGKPLQTIFSPEVTGGGSWRDESNLKDSYSALSHFMSKEMREELLHDTSISYKGEEKLRQDMDCEDAAIYRKPLF
jgi:hypothetical protein